MADGLKFRIGADVTQGVQGVQTFNRAVATIKPTVNSANNAVLGFSRVIQDLPFGFQGIANNITELPTLFRNLGAAAKESGQSIGGLLLKSLTGAGGIGIAISAITTALTFASVGFSAWTRGMKSAKEETDHFKDSVKDLASIQIDAIGSVQGQIAEVNALAKAVLDSNKPYAERKRALQELKEANESYFGDLTLEASKLATLKTKVEEYTHALVQQAIVKKFSDSIADTAKAISEQERVVQKARQALTNAHKEEEAWFVAQGKSAALANGNTADQIAAEKVLREENEKLTTLATQRVEQTNELNKAIEQGIKLQDLQTSKGKKQKSAIDEEIEAIKKQIAVLNQLKDIAGLLNREEFQLLDLNVKLAIAENIKSGALNPEQLQREIDAIVDKADLKANIPIRPVERKKISVGVGPVTGSGLSGDIAAAGETAAAAAEGNKALLQMEETAKRLHDFLVNNLGQAFLQMFDDISKGGKNALQAFGQAIAGVIKRLVAAAITAAIFAAIIGAATGGKNFGQAAGEAAKFVNGMKAIFGQLGGIKLARGGITTGPTNAIIGDNPSGKEAVIPFERMGEFINQLGGGGERLIAEVSGDSLRFILLKSNRGASRLL